MDVRLLGPVEVVVEGTPVVVGRAGERAVLALLALQAGRVVPADRLIDALWHEQLPEDPGNALQVRVSKLRRALRAAGAGAEAVVTRPSGYLLAVDPERVDAHRFARSVEDARRLVGTDSRQAERLYLEALDLWQGAPLGEFSEDWALRERARLEELYQTVLEELVELRLGAGRHGEVLPDLERLVAEHPLREHLRRQQMVALYRAGRQAEALDVYEATRQLLAEELGLDPSPELEAVRDAVLRQTLEDPGHEQVGAPVVAAPLPTRLTSIPTRLTSIVGRAADLARIAKLSADKRLLTLTGPGGAGKTTLATEAARGMVDRFPDGVMLVELAGVEEPERVSAAVADGLRVAGEGSGGVDPTERLVAAINGHEALVVLDNCEHVVDACARLVERLLTHCPRLHVLATTREPLAIPGEVHLPVRPLPVPDPDAPLEELAANDAVRLFVERAWAANPSFELDETTAGSVAEICRRLDGLPLALELAAARVASLSIEQVRERLGDRFALLTAGPRTAPARHRTLQSTIDWSHHLLDADEQMLFRRLAVFRGGWTLDQAEAVCASPDLPSETVLDVLTRLVAQSLVVPGHEHGGRFRMLEIIRVYALERLRESGETDATRRRHAECLLAFAEQAAPMLRSGSQRAWMHRLLDERDNLDAGLTWALSDARQAPDIGLRLVGALGWWWYFGRHDEGRRWVDRMLDAAERGSAGARAAAHQAAALVWRPGACVVHPSARCAQAATESLAAAEAAGDDRMAAYARLLLAVEAVAGADVRHADDLVAHAEAVLTAADDAWGLALAAFVRAEIGFRAHTMPFGTAEQLADRAAAEFARMGDGWGRSAVLAHHGSALRMAGRPAEAKPLDEESVRIAEELGLLITLQWMQAELAYCELLLGNLDRALQLCTDAEATAGRLGAGEGKAFAELVRGVAARRRGDLDAARVKFDAAARELSAAGIHWLTAAALTQGGFVAEQSGDLDAAEAAHRSALELGLAGATVAVPGALEGLACVAAAAGDPRWAAQLLGAAAASRASTRHPPDAFAQEDIDRAASAARGRLGEAGYAMAFEQGRALLPATAGARPARTSGGS